jgi:hypothetical protein
VSSADRPDPAQLAIFARMSPAAKLELARRALEEALALKAAWLRERYPHEDEATRLRRLRAWRLHGDARLD